MRPPNVSEIRNAEYIVMEGDFLVKDYTKGRKTRKCRVALQTSRNNEITLQITDVKSSPNNEVENKVFVAGVWLVYFTETNDAQIASLALVKVSAFHETLVLETVSHDNIVVLKKMEQIFQETLKVTSYDITIQEMLPDRKTSNGVVHIFRDKVLITQGFLPDLKKILSCSLHSRDNDWLRLQGTQGIYFCSNPDVFVSSEHRDDIWKTLQGCLESAKSEHHYYNLPSRPCRYIYMNMADKGRAPFSMHNYFNIFNISGTMYQNWQSCHEVSENKNHNNKELPPPCPPRRPPPLLPPRPKNRPPKSPLPPVPISRVAMNGCTAPAVPARPTSKEPIGEKELQCVVYSSKPVVGQFWVIQVIFLQRNDFSTLQRIKKLEEESNYQLLKPLPEYIKITGDSKISLLEIASGCTLKSDAEQVYQYLNSTVERLNSKVAIGLYQKYNVFTKRHRVQICIKTVEFQVVSESVLQSCWMVIEFHLEHNEQMKRNFHAKIIIEPNSTRNAALTAKREILISANFQDENGLHPIAFTCRALKDIGVREYLELCSLLDMSSALRNDWRGLAAEVGLNIEQVFKIQSKAMFPNFSPTNEVLNIWSHKTDSTCGIDELRVFLKKLQRFDALECLE